jgi:hypothetical protein
MTSFCEHRNKLSCSKEARNLLTGQVTVKVYRKMPHRAVSQAFKKLTNVFQKPVVHVLQAE